MKYISVLFLILSISISIFSETLFYESNKSGMILDEIPNSAIDEFYIKKDIDETTWSHLITFYNNGTVKKITEEIYTENFFDLSKTIITQGNNRDIETYINNNLSSLEVYKDDILINTTEYFYNAENNLSRIDKSDKNNSLIYTEYYYRNSSGGLRKIFRTTSNGYYIHWFYKDGMVVESWLIEENRSTQTIYNSDGTLSKVVVFIDDIVFSTENIVYSPSGFKISSNKTSDKIVVNKIYNSKGLVIEVKELNSDILIKKTEYTYKNEFLSKEIISGHGKKEEFLYLRDDDNEILSVVHYINGILNQKTLVESDESEIFEYYRDGVIYLKEYYISGERVQKDLFLDGILFKSESISE